MAGPITGSTTTRMIIRYTHDVLVLFAAAVAAGFTAVTGNQGTVAGLVTAGNALLAAIGAKGAPSRKSIPAWAAWTGGAAKLLTVRDGAGYVRVEAFTVTAGGGGGGCTTRTAYLCEVGDLPADAKVTSTATAIADQINATPIMPRLILANADGQIDVYVVPDAGTTVAALDLDVTSV